MFECVTLPGISTGEQDRGHVTVRGRSTDCLEHLGVQVFTCLIYRWDGALSPISSLTL